MRSRRHATCRKHPAPWWPKPKATSRKAKSQGLEPAGTRSSEPKCRRSRPTTAPVTESSASCRPRAPPPPRRRWPMRSRRPGQRRRPFSRTAPSSRPAPTPAGSFRSARSKPKAKPGPPRNRPQPGQGPARQGRAVHRAGGGQGRQEAVPRPLRRPRPRSGRSGVPDPEAFRHLLHHRSELIQAHTGRSAITMPAPSRRHFCIDGARRQSLGANFSSRICG